MADHWQEVKAVDAVSRVGVDVGRRVEWFGVTMAEGSKDLAHFGGALGGLCRQTSAPSDPLTPLSADKARRLPSHYTSAHSAL